MLYSNTALRYNLEAEWRNSIRYPVGRTLDRDDLFELGKADILTKVASLQVRGYCVVQFLVMWIIMTHGNNTLSGGLCHCESLEICSKICSI